MYILRYMCTHSFNTTMLWDSCHHCHFKNEENWVTGNLNFLSNVIPLVSCRTESNQVAWPHPIRMLLFITNYLIIHITIATRLTCRRETKTEMGEDKTHLHFILMYFFNLLRVKILQFRGKKKPIWEWANKENQCLLKSKSLKVLAWICSNISFFLQK